ncbi:glycosyltransferase [Winogradskyella sp. PC-19]|uniref:glycosyltransferase n=1 Tax=unclassified Winogradskyella TaxID=2615021 RepID=UPI000B3C81C5|nr:MULTISPECIES: glycosyltransferase [unclassified Winogradskyella]ARV10058.1 glycosyltransferase [Winogradskyella sp. PC-19]
MLFSICFIIVFTYLVIIAWFNSGFNKVEDFKLQDLKPKTKFSVIIPFRNEAKNLPVLLKSIQGLNYPNSHFEIILVNDNSDDNSLEIINKFTSTLRQAQCDIKIIDNKRTTNSPKKDAVTSAVKTAKTDWIVTTDADCVLPKYWLDSFDEFIQTNKAIAIAGPVKFTGLSSFFTRFQILDALSLQGVTIGSFGVNKPFMCNGANFVYSKKAFEQVNGFDDNATIASGDDVFLLQKFFKKDNSEVHFLKSKNAIVTTKVTRGFLEYLQQRLRWSSKTSQYKSWFPKFIGLIVLLTNLVLVSLIPLYVFEVLSGKTVVLIFLIKFSIDLLLIFKSARFYKQEPVLLSYVFASFIHPIVTTYILAILPFSTYKWKGRTFKK